MGLNALYLIYLKGSVDKIHRMEPYLIMLAFFIPLPFAIIPLVYRPNGIKIVGDVDMWCWISKKTPELQIYLWFAILWAILICNLIILGFVTAAIKKFEGELSFANSRKTRYFLIN